MKGDTAYFYNAPLSALMMYDLSNYTTSIVAQFPTERQFHFTKILKVSNDPNQLLLVEDDRGFYTLNVITGNLARREGKEVMVNKLKQYSLIPMTFSGLRTGTKELPDTT